MGRATGGLVAALALGVALAGSLATWAGAREGDRLRARLAEAASHAEIDNPNFERRSLAAAERRVAALDAGADAAEVRALEREIGRARLRLGELEGAITALGRANREPSVESLRDLAIAELRLGEAQNCVARHNAASCLWPLAPEAWHRDRAGSERAARHLALALDRDPTDPVVRWLLNLAWMTLGEWPDRVPAAARLPERLFRSEAPFPRLRNVAREAGLGSPLLSGGLAADDFDHDGDVDLVRSTVDPSGRLRYYRNAGGGRFEESGLAAGFAGLTGGLNVVQADFDNDGNLDLYVARGAWLGRAGRIPGSLLFGNGDGSFREVTEQAIGLEPAWPTLAVAIADHDRDGDLDLYLASESEAGAAFPARLLRNEGDGTFRDVAALAGVENFAFARGAAFGDYDADGWPDLYVSNLGGPNRLYRNLGGERFEDVAGVQGVERPAASFSCAWWDFDQDATLDLVVLPYEADTARLVRAWLGEPGSAELPRLYRGDGRGGFREVAAAMGLARPMSAMGMNVGDLDGDGWPELYVGTGSPALEALMPNLLFANRAGRGFADVTVAANMGHLQKGHAIALADVDGDGDLDLVAAMGGAWPVDTAHDALFANPGSGRAWVGLTLLGTASSRTPLGARFSLEIVEGGRRRTLHRMVGGGGSFGSSPLASPIGIGAAARVERLEVTWPASGAREAWGPLAAGRWHAVVEGEGQIARARTNLR